MQTFAAGDLYRRRERCGPKIAAEEFEALERNVPNLTKKVVIPGADHRIQQERPSDVSDLLISFVRGLD